MAFPPQPENVSIEFRVGDEVAAIAGGEVVRDAAEIPEAVVIADAGGFYDLVVERELAGVRVEGDRGAVERLLATLPYRGAERTDARDVRGR